jgi:hypothetical protein
MTDLPGRFRDSYHWIPYRELPQYLGEKLDCSDHVPWLARFAERHTLDRLSGICS